MMDMKVIQSQIVIALKGHPGSGKSTLAQAIAKTLKIPLIDKDHFRDCTHQIQQALMPNSSNTATKLLNDLSYEAMWAVTAAQLSLGLNVVIDSPLSKRAHLDRLLELASATNAQVLIVECRPGDEIEWRRRLESRGRMSGSRWHKPSTWRDIESLLEGYGGCWDYDVGEAPKLVLDTTDSVEVAELVDMIIDFVGSCNLDEVNCAKFGG